MSKARVLLTSSYGPNKLAWGEDQYDLAKSRLARGHGIFVGDSHMHYFALYIIAENLSCPVTVLENPHFDEFERELGEGYDYVGIQLKSIHTTKVARMMGLVREKFPSTKIIIGGYGVGALGHIVPGDINGDAEYIRDNADYLCREEGVQFMRRILDDEPVDREITQYHMPSCGMHVPGVPVEVTNPNILVSLGCPNACDFCNTSAFFYHKKIYVAQPDQVVKYMKHYQKRYHTKDFFVGLFDEDFFLDPDYVRELGRLLMKDRNLWGIQWFSFGSTRSLSKFTAEELRDYGCGQIWIGVESFLPDGSVEGEQYAKRKGADIKKLFADLHKNGVSTVGSIILGQDFHTRDNIKADIDQFVDLKPMLYQISPLTPCPGTALYDRMLEEGRILDSYKWEDVNLWKDDVFKLKNFEFGEIREYYDYAHEQIRDRLGPPNIQFMESVLDGYQSLKKAGGEMNEYRAKLAKRTASGLYATLHSIKRLHNSPIVRERALMLEKRYRKEIGGPPLVSTAVSHYMTGNLRRQARKTPQKPVSDPPPRWTYYNTNGPGDDVYVRKGRKAKKAVPYRNRGAIKFDYFHH